MSEIITLLYIDDQPRYRRTILQDLKDYNIAALGEASNGKEGLLLLENVTPHVVLLDLEMPEMDGSETFNKIKKIYPELKVIILSQHDDPGLIENFKQRGVYGYIPKRVVESDIRLLAEAITTVKKSSFYFYSKDTIPNFTYTEKEIAVIPHLMDAKTSKEIASELGMEEKKVNKLRSQLHRKTQSRNAIAFITYSLKKGLKYLRKK